MRVLITGGAGFIGSAVAQAALETGFDVHLTWRQRAPTVDAPAHRVDLSDREAAIGLVQSVNPQVIVHAAAGMHRPLKSDQRTQGWRDSVFTTVNLLEACRSRGPLLVHLASSHEFAPGELPHPETGPLDPISPRGAMKLAALVAVRQWARETGNPTVVVRPFSVYGPGQPRDKLLPTLLRCVRDGLPFATPASTTRRDFVYVQDVAQGVLAAATLPQAIGGEFNLATGRATSVTELVALVEEVTGRRVELRPGKFPLPSTDRAHWTGDPSLARERLGWSATTDLREGLRKTLEAMT